MVYIWYIHIVYVTCIPYKIYIINAYKKFQEKRQNIKSHRPMGVVANEGILIQTKVMSIHALKSAIYAGA